MYEMNERALVEQLDYSKIPNAANLMPSMKYAYGIGHIYSGKVVLYNPEADEGADGLRRHARSQARQQARHHRHPVPVHDGRRGPGLRRHRSSNFEPGKERLIACRKAGARIYPTNEAFAQALKTEEIACGIMWKARAVQWQNAGTKVETVAPKEGVPIYVSGFVMPKNAPNKEGAYAWLNAMMAPSAQESFAVDMGYNPTVTNAKVPPTIAEAHRLHRRRAEAPGRPRLRLPGARTTPPSRIGGTSRSRASRLDARR